MESLKMEFDFDAIVVGSGAGGASFAHACSAAGKSVLVIERGSRPSGEMLRLNEHANLIDKKPYDDREINVNNQNRQLYMGGVLGGGTSVYGAALLRPSTEDFQPGKHYSNELSSDLWEWPIDYQQLRPYYDEAEKLFKVSTSGNVNFSPLESPDENLANNGLPLASINQRLIKRNQTKGLRPFRLPLAIDSEQCQKCDSCAGFLCPHGARRSAAQLVDEASAKHHLKLMTNSEVEKLETSGNGQIESIVVRNRQSGEQQRFRARCYALAAGAIGSPAIMLRSGMDMPQVGRNYMMHFSPICVGLFPRSTGANETFVKQVGFADYYFGTEDYPKKMGIIQSLPAPGPLMMAKSGLNRLPKCFLRSLRKRMLPLVGIIEDLPNPQNRVFIKPDGSIGLHQNFSRFDKERGESLGRMMRHILRRAGAAVCMSRSFPSQEHVAHQCGTLRFGHTPKTAVADANCRVFGRENLFVVDGSVLPTSLGVGPSLTIVANALRVAQIAVAGM